MAKGLAQKPPRLLWTVCVKGPKIPDKGILQYRLDGNPTGGYQQNYSKLTIQFNKKTRPVP